MSLSYCVVKGCPRVESGGCLFRFPKEANLRKQWLQRLQLSEEDIGISEYVCGRHFDEKHLTRQTNGTTLLHREAVPEPVSLGERGYNSLRPSAASSCGQQFVDSSQGLDELVGSLDRKRRQPTESAQNSPFKQARKDILESMLRELLPKGSDTKRNKRDQPADQQEGVGCSAVNSDKPKAHSSSRRGRRSAVDRERSQENEGGEPLTQRTQALKTSGRPTPVRSASLKAAKGRGHQAKREAEPSVNNNDRTKNDACQECAEGFRAMESHVKRLDSKLDAVLALLETLKGASPENAVNSTLKKLPKKRARVAKREEESIKVSARPTVSLRRPEKRIVEPKSEETFSPSKPAQSNRSARPNAVSKTQTSFGGKAQKTDLDMATGKAVLMFLGRGFSTYHLRKFGSSVLSDVSPVVLNDCIEQLRNEGLLKSLGQLELRFPNVNSKTQMNLEVFKKSFPTDVMSQQLAPYGLTREAYAAAFFGRHHSKLKQINVLCDADDSSSASA